MLTAEQYTEGVCGDGAAILCNGVPMSVSEILAALNADNREAQPVALVDRRQAASGGICWQNGGKDLPHGTKLFTAPPAPAVPEEMTAPRAFAMLMNKGGVMSPVDSAVFAWNACRAAMLAQPVSSGYTLPEGFKLMPLEMTDEIGEAIAMEARCCGGIALCIYEAALAAAPEGGNDA